MKFVYNGGEAGQQNTVFAGRAWKAGVVLDVQDPGSIALLKAHEHFNEDGKAPAPIEPSPQSQVLMDQLKASIALADMPPVASVNPSDLSDEELERLTAPEAVDVPNAFDDADVTQDAPKRRGRVPGSKNKPKVTDGNADNG